jgi:hypothetical protein
MARGIEGTNIFRTDKDRGDFLDRLAAQCETDALKVYAWALIPNHFHLLVQTSEIRGRWFKYNCNPKMIMSCLTNLEMSSFRHAMRELGDVGSNTT